MNDPMEGICVPSSRLKRHNNYTRALQDILDDARQAFGICCFSDTRDNELMWAHYASNYAGICVGYRPDRLIKGLADGVHLLRLSYGNEPPAITEADMRSVIDTARRVLSHKKSNWVYEREWRLLGPLGKIHIESKACARHVYLGSRIRDDYKSRIVSALKGKPVAVFDMKVSGYSHDWTKIKSIKV